MALGSTQPLTEISTRNISWRCKGSRYVGLTTFICRLSWYLGASTSRNLQGLSRPGMGLLYLYLTSCPHMPSSRGALLWTGTNVPLQLLSPWSRGLLEKLTGSQLVKKFPAFYGTRRFITAFTRARHLSLSPLHLRCIEWHSRILEFSLRDQIIADLPGEGGGGCGWRTNFWFLHFSSVSWSAKWEVTRCFVKEHRRSITYRLANSGTISCAVSYSATCLSSQRASAVTM
jgi:hypothetical protein